MNLSGQLLESHQAVDVNSRGTRWLTYLIFSTTLVVYYLFPIWAGIFSEHYQFKPTQVGWLLSADMLSNTIAAFSARYWIHRCAWRRIMPLTVIVVVIPNLLCAVIDSFAGFLLLRYLAGIGAGAMVAFMYAIVSASNNPDREFAYAMSAQVFLGAICLIIAPWIWSSLGPEAIFVLCGILGILPMMCFKYLPYANPLSSNIDLGTKAFSSRSGHLALLGLVGIGLFFASMNSIWSFTERIGDAQGFSMDFIARVLSVSLIFSFCGAIVPAWLAGRVSRIVVLSIGYLVLAIAITILGSDMTAPTYAVMLCLYNFFYSFVIPFQNGWIAALDHNGRTIVLLPAVQGVGISIGPMLAGMVITNNNYQNVAGMSVFLLMAGYVFFVFMQARAKHCHS